MDKKIMKNDELLEKEESVESIDDFDEILEGVPEDKRAIIKMMVSSVQMRGTVSSENAVAKKITDEHITQYLEGARQEMENSYNEKKQSKVFAFLVIFVAMLFIVVIILLLKETPETMEKIIYGIIGFVGGIVGGYGFGKSKKDE